jgi:quercetin dioxygenase-like cupin family protein
MALHHARAGEIIDLRPLGDNLKLARTEAIVKSDLFEAVRLIVHAGMKIDEHDVEGPIMLHCLEGHVLLGLAGSNVSLKEGQWMYLEGGARHSVSGIEESSLLLTILFKR